MLAPLSIGNAVRVFVTPGAGWVCWRVLRRTADAFTGPDDAGAVVVADQSADNVLMDTFQLINGSEYFYRAYGWTGSAWVDGGDSLSATPDATYVDLSPDPQSIVRERIELGLAIEVARGDLVPGESGVIRAVTAPFGLPDMDIPVVSVHHDTTAPSDRVVGEDVSTMDDDEFAAEGWLARTTLSIVGVTLNGDERLALRKSIARVVKANLPVFASHGIVQIEFSQNDSETFGQDNVVIYRTNGSFSCLAPSYITAPVPIITEVDTHPFVGTDALYG